MNIACNNPDFDGPGAPVYGDIDLAKYPHFTIRGVTLINGCAMELLPRIEGLADLLVSDPPYRLTAGGKNGKAMGGIFASSKYNNNGRLMRIVEWEDMAKPLLAACRTDADAYIMSNDKNVFRAQQAFTSVGWKVHNLLVWDKTIPTRNRWYMKEIEFVLYLWKGRARTIRNPGSTQIYRAKARRGNERIHPTEKPVELMSHYIANSSCPGELVLDPFAGSASTLIAAALCGRRALGFEADPVHFAAACRRLMLETT